MIKTIIFDLGGVYLNRGIWIAEEKFSKKFNIPLEKIIQVFIKENYKPYFSGKISEEEFWKRIINSLKIKADWKELRKILLDSFKPQEKMPQLINKLKENYRIGLLSDQTKEWWPYLNKKYQISSKFNFTVISSETGYNKPELEIYKIALNKSNNKPEECLFIDDLEHNLPPAKELGIKTIHFKNPEQLQKELTSIGIKF